MSSNQQQWAQSVYQHVKQIEEKEESVREEYGRLCLYFPSLLQTSGLCQAVGFFQAKGERNRPAYKLYIHHLAETLGVSEDWSIARKADLLEYIRLSRQAKAAAEWYKRYAEAILKIEPNNQKG